LKKYFAYIRVSTTRQGEHGVSLQQQRESIEHLAARSGMEISEWMEEQETAAKQGRPVFTTMLRRLRNNEAVGVLIHKIDRSARNLKDWAELGQLIDQGIEVHFSNESVDLKSRGGRLSADIQAVVAADYIRNLREEVKKGFYGRLKQGIMPLPAPLGYLNGGAGKPKPIDPVAGPIIQEAFRLYATGSYGQHALMIEVNRMGLRTRKGKKVSVNVVARILSNRFYTGVIQLKRSGQVYKGLHIPLVTPVIFQKVQDVLTGRTARDPGKHNFMYSRFIACETCRRSLIAERQKGHVYYRCHIRSCPPTSVREKAIDEAISDELKKLNLTAKEVDWIEEFAAEKKASSGSTLDAEEKHLKLQIAALDDRQNRLTDAFIDGALERADFDNRKAALTIERCNLEQRLSSVQEGQSEVTMDVEKKVELIKNAWLLHEQGVSMENRDMLAELTSNRSASGKNVMITLQSPLQTVIDRPKNSTGGSVRGRDRTFWKKFLLESSQRSKNQQRSTRITRTSYSTDNSSVSSVLDAPPCL
jgi:site-specific DNA recombinase